MVTAGTGGEGSCIEGAQGGGVVVEGYICVCIWVGGSGIVAVRRQIMVCGEGIGIRATAPEIRKDAQSNRLSLSCLGSQGGRQNGRCGRLSDAMAVV